MSDGERRAAEHLLPLIYNGLLKLARRRMERYGSREFQNPAELVHEGYLRAVKSQAASFEGCRHLFFVVNRTMQDLLVESVRRHAAGKRGGGLRSVELETVEISVEPDRRELLDLDRALRKLARDNPGCARVVVLSYFFGLTHPEIASLLRLSRATVERRWKYARLWLRRELSGDGVRGFANESQLIE